MPLETGDWIEDLVETNPLGTDPKSQGDDHLRLIKHILKTQFPNLGSDAVNATALELNALTDTPLSSEVEVDLSVSKTAVVPAWCTSMLISIQKCAPNANNNLVLRLGVGGVPQATAYNSCGARAATTITTTTTNIAFLVYSADFTPQSINFTLQKDPGSNGWSCSHVGALLGAIQVLHGAGHVDLAGPCDLVEFDVNTGVGFSSGKMICRFMR